MNGAIDTPPIDRHGTFPYKRYQINSTIYAATNSALIRFILILDYYHLLLFRLAPVYCLFYSTILVQYSFHF
ncbi:hypothetical protein BDF19DRAFT_205174 [Syncephalis fuscata]|nr:hypothetical protein BDF19DRAFT_205174 [Syncephalis fuscata]